MDQVKDTPFTDCCPRRDSQGDKTTDDAPAYETKQRLEYVLAVGQYFTKSMTIFINAIIDEVNDG